MKVVYPPWAKPGCKMLGQWYSTIKSGDAVGLAKWCLYTTGKGDPQECMMWVRWGLTAEETANVQ